MNRARVDETPAGPGAADDLFDAASAGVDANGALQRTLERLAVDLDLRKTPTQPRGAASFNAILDATARLLEEGGAEVLTTNLVAEIAGVNIATLYQYFPSKEAILLALYRRDTDARIGRAENLMRGLGTNDDWRVQLGDAIDESVWARRKEPGAGPLRRLMRASPHLRAFEQETMARGARALAAELTRREGRDPERAAVAALCAVELYAALLDLRVLNCAGGLGHEDDRIVAECKRLIFGLLAPFLDPS